MVSASGQIKSSENFTCQYANTNTYTVSYGDYYHNPVPVITLVSTQPGLSFSLSQYSGGFTLYTWKTAETTPTPEPCDFNFHVAEM